MKIVDQYGFPIKELRQPSFGILPVAPLLGSDRDYVSTGLTPERIAEIFIDADSGDISRQAELFEQIEEKDAHIIGEKGKRVNSILGAEYQINPASEDSKDVKIQEYVQEWYKSWDGVNSLLTDMQDAIGKGFTGHEIKWDGKESLPYSIDFMAQKRFTFVDNDGLLLKYPLLLTDDEPMGVPIPQWKLIFHKNEGSTGHAVRSGVFRVCSWMYLFKNFSIKDWLAFNDGYGMPLRLGKYATGAQNEEKDALYAAVQAIGHDSAGIISKETEIEFIETASRNNGGDLFEKLYKLCNREISKALTGTSQSSDSENTGSYGSDMSKVFVLSHLTKADARAACDTINNQLIRPIVGFRFGWDVPIPKLKATWKEKEDLKAKAETISIISQTGLEISKSQIYEDFGLKQPESEDDILKKQFQPEPEPEQPGTITKLIAKNKPKKPASQRLADEVDPFLSAAIDSVKAYIMKAKSLDDIRDGVFNLFPEMNSSDIGKIMTEAMILGELKGQDEG